MLVEQGTGAAVTRLGLTAPAPSSGRFLVALRGFRDAFLPHHNRLRSAYQAAANKAKELGYTNVKHMSAGIAGWKEAGMKLEKVPR